MSLLIERLRHVFDTSIDYETPRAETERSVILMIKRNCTYITVFINIVNRRLGNSFGRSNDVLPFHDGTCVR